MFRRLATKPLDAEVAGTMQELIADHVFARRVTGRLSDASARYAEGDETGLAEIESSLASLVDLYPAHIDREDRHFFKPCLEYFTDAEKQQMLSDFDEFDRALIHEKYAGVVERLEQRG